jgi:hypothetical protein
LPRLLRPRGAPECQIPRLPEQTLRDDSSALARWIAAQGDDHQFLLLIDQAEELITQNRDASVQSSFVLLISKALDQIKQIPIKAHRFTAAEANTAIEALGFSKVTDLAEDDTAVWRATAVKDTKAVPVALDFGERPLRVIFTIRSEFEP